MINFTPSENQITIRDFVLTGSGDGVVNAVAGSGKTTTIEWVIRMLAGKSVLAIAFNKHIAEEMQKKIGDKATCKTIHSLGMGALYRALKSNALPGTPKLTKLQVMPGKLNPIVTHVIADARMSPEDADEAWPTLKKLSGLVRIKCVNANDIPAIKEICHHHGLIPDATVLRLVAKVLQLSNTQFELDGVLDFDDMVYQPVRLNLPVQTADWIFVDEAQDLNRAQLEIALKARADDGRMLFVGDRQQAIYGFAGADASSFDNIIKKTNATELPLSTCYRCPTDVLHLARAIVPQITARTNAPQGAVEFANEEDLVQLANEGDLILCRVNAPNIKWCIAMIKAGRSAKVRGRDVGKEIVLILDKVQKLRGFKFDEIIIYINKWRQQQMVMLAQKDASEATIENLNDKVDCLQIFAEQGTAANPLALRREIEDLFSDERTPIWFSSVHKSKGLENPRIIILRPQRMPFVPNGNQQDWEIVQEHNLIYVAVTRAQETLTVLGDLPKPIRVAYASHVAPKEQPATASVQPALDI